MELRAKDIPSVDPTGAGIVLVIIAQGERILREALAAKRKVLEAKMESKTVQLSDLTPQARLALFEYIRTLPMTEDPAILAERERCAAIVRKHLHASDPLPQWILTEILNPDAS